MCLSHLPLCCVLIQLSRQNCNEKMMHGSRVRLLDAENPWVVLLLGPAPTLSCINNGKSFTGWEGEGVRDLVHHFPCSRALVHQVVISSRLCKKRCYKARMPWCFVAIGNRHVVSCLCSWGGTGSATLLLGVISPFVTT